MAWKYPLEEFVRRQGNTTMRSEADPRPPQLTHPDSRVLYLQPIVTDFDLIHGRHGYALENVAS